MRFIAVRGGIPEGFRSTDDCEAVRTSLSLLKATPVVGSGKLKVLKAPRSIRLGRSAAIELEVVNTTDDVTPVIVEAHLPFGAGLSLDGSKIQSPMMEPHSKCRVTFPVRADRPHEVNLGKPWILRFTAGADCASVEIAVPDPRPGRTFYLLTEDCETFDGGPRTGNYARGGLEIFGNQNNFMDPEDYRIQMVEKPNRLNEIARRHGARWTHFYTITQLFAAEWAARKSATGEWNKVVARIKASIRAGSTDHEYAPHIHFDYEPESNLPPQPRLIYDKTTDGILPNDYYDPELNPNHRYHDWDGSARRYSYLKALGDWTTLDSKTGSLRKCLKCLSQLTANRRAILVGRTGSHDFGQASEDQQISTSAYFANGLRGNSDAYFPGSPPEHGGQMFWCVEGDRGSRIENLSSAKLVQLKISMDTNFRSAEDVNEWFKAARDTCRGPGVHAILFTSHAMFFSGEPDPLRSLEGGAFDELDSHLRWVRKTYPDIEFATASEAVLEFLDYYTPALEAHIEPFVRGGDPGRGHYEFEVRLLGQGIRVDDEHPREIRISAPHCFSAGDLTELWVKQDGNVIAATRNFDPARQPSIPVAIHKSGPLRLGLQLKPEAIQAAMSWFSDSGSVMFYDPREAKGSDLLYVGPPRSGETGTRFSGGGMKLLMNSVAGNPEPLGRRTHPLSAFAIGAALRTAFERVGRRDAVRLKVRWLRTVDPGSDFIVRTENKGGKIGFEIEDDSGLRLIEGELELAESTGQPEIHSINCESDFGRLAGIGPAISPPVSPEISGICPDSVIAGTSFQTHDNRSTIAILGSNFRPGALVMFEGKPLPTTFGDAGFLSAGVEDILLIDPRPALVWVRNLDGQESNRQTFRIVEAC